MNLSPREMAHILNRMQLRAQVSAANARKLQVAAPITRSDILHPCDIMEGTLPPVVLRSFRRTRLCAALHWTHTHFRVRSDRIGKRERGKRDSCERKRLSFLRTNRCCHRLRLQQN